MNEPLRKVHSYFIITIIITVHFYSAYPMKNNINHSKHACTRTGGVKGVWGGGVCAEMNYKNKQQLQKEM